jgi:hypothetical protein
MADIYLTKPDLKYINTTTSEAITLEKYVRKCLVVRTPERRKRFTCLGTLIVKLANEGSAMD